MVPAPSGTLARGTTMTIIAALVHPIRLSRSITNRPARSVKVLLPDMRQLSQSLTKIKRAGYSLYSFVDFFTCMSIWHDRVDELERIIYRLEEADYGQHGELIALLKLLILHFRNGGRSEFGINRTKRGEQVTTENVYVGGIYGLMTYKVKDWMALDWIHEVGHFRRTPWERELGEYSDHQVMCMWAKMFMDSHIGPVIESIRKIEKLLD